LPAWCARPCFRCGFHGPDHQRKGYHVRGIEHFVHFAPNRPAPRRGAPIPRQLLWHTPTKASSPALPIPSFKRTEKASCYRLLIPIRIDTVRRQGTTRRIQSSADFLSIERAGEPGFSCLLCPLGNSGKNATGMKPEVLPASGNRRFSAGFGGR